MSVREYSEITTTKNDASAVEKCENALLELIKEKSLKSITVQDILKRTGLSRQTFYRKFLDKQDLINRTYRDKVTVAFNDRGFEINHYYASLDFGARMHHYKTFLKQAVKMEGQNSLREYMFQYYVEWYENNLRKRGRVITGDVKKILRFCASGAVNMYIGWLENDMPETPEEMAEDIRLCEPKEMRKWFVD